MKSIWLESALDDLDATILWVSCYDLDAALKLDEEVAQLVKRLEQFPLSGRAGRVKDTREAIVDNYVMVYRVTERNIEILRFIHGARQYPPFPED
ncbi:MAG: type II toxin-antitoxin system RelE/ParE family toxin [Desulfovibrio sp.]|nr:type II toxin-antitoxin system RelE/ParE family toxin [Desulfovibrio sp.]